MQYNIDKLYIFEWIDRGFLEKIIEDSNIKNYNSWDIIIKEWDLAKEVFIIISWIVSVIKKWKVVNTIFEWDIFWEIALVMNEPRTASIKAETDLKLLVINKETFIKLLWSQPNWDYIKDTILNRIIMK